MLENGPLIRPSFREWLETDGFGGFASSTSLGIHTRRYHGWLFLSGDDPGERWLALSKLEDECHLGDSSWDLSSNRYPGAIHPAGDQNLWAFRLLPFPCYIFKMGDLFLEREIMMARGQRGVFVAYRLLSSPLREADDTQVTLTLRPLCNFRFYHHTAKEGSWAPKFYPLESALVLQGHPVSRELLFSCPMSAFSFEPDWYKDMVYLTERERGLDDREDHLSPGHFTVKLGTKHPAVFWAGPLPDSPVSTFVKELPHFYRETRSKELARRQRAYEGGETPLLGRLHLAADQFVVSGKHGTSIIAGYHWFGEWGRDAFISLPGLLLRTGKFEEAKQVFRRFAEAINGGLVPNRFVEGSGAAYNSADASLWMIHALKEYEKTTGDFSFVESLLPFVRRILNSYMKGTFFSTRMDDRSLLWAGTKDSQITWMDACAHGVPVTPRWGYPVEINGLWVHALGCMTGWERRAESGHSVRYAGVYRQAASEFLKLFTWPGGGLYDRVDESGPVEEVRPNQVIAAACDHLALPQNVLRDVLRAAVRKLLTPVGLRTLDPASPAYRGRYGGPPFERDSAYHQGTAWPWLLGPFFDVANKVDESGAKLKERLLSALTNLDDNPCMGSVFEVASGDAPFDPGGAVAQAWSVGEILRILSSNEEGGGSAET